MSLPDRAVLVRLTRSMYQPYAFDEEATERAGGKKTGRFNKKLLANSTRLRSVNSAYSALYTYVRGVTLPWLDDGVRMLKASEYMEFSQQVGHLESLANQAAHDLADHWDEEIDADRKRFSDHAALTGQPNMFNIADYPTKDALRGMFKTDIKIYPIPSRQDFRIQIHEEDIKALEDEIAKTQQDITKHVMKEILDPVSKLAAKLADEKGIFRDSLVENVLEVLDRAPKLNINDDPEINDMLADLRKVAAGISPKELRKDVAYRKEVVDNVSELEKRLEAYNFA